MGRKERRAQERELRKLQKQESKDQVFDNFMKSQIKKSDNIKKEVDRIRENEISIQLECTTCAMAMVLHDKYGFDTYKISELLEEMSNLTSQIGNSEEYPNPSEFKIKSALATGINIGLNKKEKEKVEQIYRIAWEGEDSDEYTIENI